MSDSILSFLERLGRDGDIEDRDAYAAAVAALDLGEAESRMLAARDAEGLSALLGGRREMTIQIWAPSRDPKRKRQTPDETDVPEPDRPDEDNPPGDAPDSDAAPPSKDR